MVLYLYVEESRFSAICEYVKREQWKDRALNVVDIRITIRRPENTSTLHNKSNQLAIEYSESVGIRKEFRDLANKSQNLKTTKHITVTNCK